ncbi:MAG: hypothetical protein DME75_08715 [Verrucomicrobia bacterium]|nr:MAG: hypothetical protein DME75_08715 [Verrucomicrobiota bacterium]
MILRDPVDAGCENDEIRMTNDESMTKREARIPTAHSHLQGYFVIRISSFLRHSSFVLRHFR